MSKESLRTQVSKVKKAVLKIRTVHNPGMWKKEGEDHINISKNSETKLGRLLSLDNVRHWEHSLLGPFRSLNSLWFFLKAVHKSDEIRTITGFDLKNFVNRRCGGQVGRIPHFQAVILESAYQRVLYCPDIAAAILESDLPFDCYRVVPASGVCVRFEHSTWLTRGYEEIREALKENREPNFNSFRDQEAGGIYDAVLKMVSPNHEVLAKQAQAARVTPEKPKKKPGEKPAVYDASKITNIDTAPMKKSGKPADAKPVAKEILPDFKVAAVETKILPPLIEHMTAEENQSAVIGIDPSAGQTHSGIALVKVGDGEVTAVEVLDVAPASPAECQEVVGRGMRPEVTIVDDFGGSTVYNESTSHSNQLQNVPEFTSVTREESGITAILPDEPVQVNALQAALMSSGLAADSQSVVAEELVSTEEALASSIDPRDPDPARTIEEAKRLIAEGSAAVPQATGRYSPD